MCGIFGIIPKNKIDNTTLKSLSLLSRERGKDSSGFLNYDINNKEYLVRRFNKDIKFSIDQVLPSFNNLVIGHSRLITNSTPDNQPVISNDIVCIHNGIITNFKSIYLKYQIDQKLEIDSEVLPALTNYYLNQDYDLEKIIDNILEDCEGIVNCVIAIPTLGKMLLFSNNGSLFIGKNNNNYYFASEKYFLEKINCNNIHQITKKIIDIAKSDKKIVIENNKNTTDRDDFVPALSKNRSLEKLLIHIDQRLQRCSKCILPSTMPFIKFDGKGVCNYCNNYENKNIVKYDPTKTDYIFDKYRKTNKQADCIVPLSGGRDSCFALHLAKTKFNLNPIAYTYDWGLVTDLARRNISRMCSRLNVENIIFADDISKKRNFIKKNVVAWLEKPHLGMVNLFTAGDKHFFRHVRTVKKRTGLKLDLWGINPYEVTHFKAGFLGVAPNFESRNVYTTGIFKQLNYHSKRIFQMMVNPSYLNYSIFDNLYGEFYRSIVKKKDFYSIFDFYRWNESEVDETLKLYDWERSVDTKSTWRIGDGAAAFYNYIYYTMAGFSEHDTFRSNQIREGDITREKALELVKIESRPRFENIKWFLQIINLDFENTIKKINMNRLKL
jgi:glucosamine--fructose-6-phosphate aminotransferase (isomerizing)